MVTPSFERYFECGTATRAIPGEELSGDRCLMHFSADNALFAVIDGAGHGPEATSAAAIAATTLELAKNSSPALLLGLSHNALRSTRGAAISLATLAHGEMSWAGVGNVEVILSQKSEDGSRKNNSLLLRNGIVGHRFSQPRVSILPFSPGDLLVFTTDGVRSHFLEGIALDEPCQVIADSIMSQYGKDSDDALVLVVRVVPVIGVI